MNRVFDESWRNFLEGEFKKDYFLELANFLEKAYLERKIFPRKSSVFRAFLLNFEEIKVVILGQDPYHTPDLADGLAFSVPKKAKIPPSLVNIYKEIDAEFGSHNNKSGDLSDWAKQGVLLLNNVLTVEKGRAGSHRGMGWESFTEEVIKKLNKERSGLVFVFWGRDARSKVRLIDKSKHLVLESAHPSPLSAHGGFFGCGHFKKINEYLKNQGKKEIIW